MQVGAKAALFLGVVLLLGAGVFVRWIARDLVRAASSRRIQAAVWTGAVLVLGGSALEVLDTISRAAGSVDASLVGLYLSETRHGNLVLARAVIVGVLIRAAARARPRRVDTAAFVGLGVSLLLTLSLVSHAGAQPGFLPVLADLLHLIGVAGWAGALLYGAWLVSWHAPQTAAPSVERAVRRLSAVGAWGVALIVATGVYASVKNIWGPQALTGTAYGRTLLIKLGLVAMVWGVAAVNRWVLIPSVARGAAAGRLAGLVKIESLLLLAVLGATSALVVQPPPGAPPTLSRPLTFREILGPWAVRGTVERRDPGRFAVELVLGDAAGAAPPAGVAVDLTLTMLEHEMAPVHAALARIRPGTYRGTLFLPMAGRWQMTIHAGAGTARVPIQTDEAAFVQTASPWRVVLPGIAVILTGVAFFVAGLRRMGAGLRGSRPAIVSGIVLVLVGTALALRAAGD